MLLLLKPILSRFCNIYIPLPTINKKKQSLHTFNKKNIINNEYLLKHKLWLKRNLIKKGN